MKRIIVMAFLSVLIATAAVPQDFSSLIGYYVFATDFVDTYFTGCRPGKAIRLLQSPISIECRDSGVHFAHQPSVAILVKNIANDSENDIVLNDCKLLIETKIYRANCDDYIKWTISSLRQFRDSARKSRRSGAVATVDEMLRLYEALKIAQSTSR